ncbi:3-dehydroquinate synthase [Aliikangiella sp. IMCC44359]|uniref:3-dehydroquinate synthase n=1 Tax=Aliikangiella sp. IMCC44359 TaxID=3459125 RepID=UPI00403B1285
MRQLALNLGERSYNIYIEQGLIDNASLIESFCEGDNVLILSNEVVAPLYIDSLARSLPNKKIHQFLLTDGEAFKNIESFTAVIDYLINHGFRRNDTLIALGGGVVGDLGGFVAASYQRGMGFIQFPTTVLAQVDSSVGGKTAVNHPLGKNMIGAFYQPKAVFIDTNTLKSLPEKEYYSGFAEIVKYAILGSLPIKEILFNKLAEIRNKDINVLAEIIYHSCAKKAEVVSEDEKEKGSRALLNLGHTFGHAIERLTEYKTYLHGEAVSIGTLMAFNLSLAKGLIKAEVVEQYRELLLALKLPDKVNLPISSEQMLEAMKLDKKNLTNKYRLVLPKNDHCILVEEDKLELIEQSIVKQLK